MAHGLLVFYRPFYSIVRIPMEKFDKRVLIDRRKQPTPGLSKFTLWGRRKTFRRREDREKQGYVDLYQSALLILLTLNVGLTVLDALFTIMILDDSGWEINPVVRSAIQLYGDGFWIWKFIIVSIPLALLCIHSKFRFVMPTIFVITGINIAVILYEIFAYLY